MESASKIPLAARLKSARLAKGYTLQRSADSVSVALRTYQNYEAGDRCPSLEVLVALAREFGVTTDYLLGLESEAPSD